MSSVAPPPQARAGELVRVHLSLRVGLLAIATASGCYSGLGPDEAEPSDTAASSGDDGVGEGGSADAGDSASAGDGASADEGAGEGAGAGESAGEGASADEGGSADEGASAADEGSGDSGGTQDDSSAGTGTGDSGTDGGVVDDGGAADDGTEADDGAVEDDGGDDGAPSEVPDNVFCDPVAAWNPAWSTLEQQILDIVNQRRSEGADCGTEGSFGPAGPLTMNPALRCAARVQSKQMVDNDFFAHTTPWGETPGNRIDAAGYSWSTWGENIAAGNATAAATMDQWMGSDGHCANIMNASFSEIGVGYYPGGDYGHYWTQAFGHP